MSEQTGIEWTDSTWNPTRGCSRVSEGCRNCYAERTAVRYSGPGMPYEGFAEAGERGGWTRRVALVERKLEEPLRWLKPRRIFVDSMSDLFHEALPTESIDRVFGVMALASWHTMQVLTKRPERMRSYVEDPETPQRVAATLSTYRMTRTPQALAVASAEGVAEGLRKGWRWPLANLWLGTSVEDQKVAEQRVEHLTRTPAIVRFLSCEPLLGPLDVSPWLVRAVRKIQSVDGVSRNADGTYGLHYTAEMDGRVDWVIAGGESGPAARPMSPRWPRMLRDQCAEYGVHFFFKQWGEWAPRWECPEHSDTYRYRNVEGWWMERVGKKAAGRMLDGREWNESPTGERAPTC